VGRKVKFRSSRETVAQRGAAFLFVVAIEYEREKFDDDTVVAIVRRVFFSGTRGES
jgi:hypothetical protein